MNIDPAALIRLRLHEAERDHAQLMQQVAFYNGIIAALRDLASTLERRPDETTPEEADALAAFASSNEGGADGIQHQRPADQ